MALPDVAPVLAKDFVILKIDQDRMIGGKDVLARYRKEERGLGGLPWFVFLDGNGNTVISSDDPDKGNIGYPGLGGAQTHFRRMLERAAKRMTPADIDALLKSVKAFTTARVTT